MKRILLCSYHFPPGGGAGAQRPTKFARYLAEVGYRPTILTGTGGAAGRWTPRDESLYADLPADTVVYRVPGPEPANSRLAGRLERWLRIRSPWARWWQSGIVAAADAIGEVEAIWTVMTPYTSAAASARLARRLDRPWIADLGDPWALDEMMIYPTGLHRRLERRTMRAHLSTAAAIVMSTPEAVLRVRALLPDYAGPIVAIGNGYDGADFRSAPSVRRDGKLRIVHTGYLHSDLGTRQRKGARIRRVLGGNVAPVDLLTRSHVFLLRALDLLLDEDPKRADRIELHLAGVISDLDRELAERLPITRIHGYLSHGESLSLLRSADLLFLPMQKLLDGSRAGIVPGKTYEYLASGRPILGAVPPGDARDLLLRAGGNFLVEPDDVDAMADVVRSLLDDPRPREGVRDNRVVADFDYRSLVRRVAHVLDEVVGVAPPLSSGRREASGALA